jgi:ribonucleoside-diphosphate reductase alpha chain
MAARNREYYSNVLEAYKEQELAPQNMTLEAFVTLQKSLYEYADGRKETPMEMYRRVAETAGEMLPAHPRIAEDFYYLISNNYLGLATPVAANLGTPASSLPISCYVIEVQDSIQGIFWGLFKAAMLTKCGGGVGVGLSPIREQGHDIRGGGKSNGAKPWGTIYDFASRIVSQAGVRRGQFSFYINIESADLWDMLLAKDHSKGDPRSHLHSNIAVNVSDEFMERLLKGDKDAINRWNAVLRCRQKAGSPYLHYIGNANRGLVTWMKELGKKITGSNICTEISSCADKMHDMVCCLASMNLLTYDEWRDWQGYYGDAIFTATLFLDAVMEYFIRMVKSDPEEYRGFEDALRYAENGRPLGLGVFGQHAYYMKNGWEFASDEARNFNEEYHKMVWKITDSASVHLGDIYGPCAWAKSHGRRNIQTTSIAPTVGNSVTNMGITPGIEPIAGNYYEATGAAGKWLRINTILVDKLKELGIYSEEMMDRILEDSGSIQNIDEIPDYVKRIFLTFTELDQKEIIYQASQRQPYLEQTQSVNLSFKEDADADYISDVHIMAYQGGLHTLYYLRGESVQRNALKEEQMVNRDKGRADDKDLFIVITKEGCPWCEKAIKLLADNDASRFAIDRKDEEAVKFGQYVPSSHTTFPQIFKYDGSGTTPRFIGGYNELAGEMLSEYNIENKQEDCAYCDG